MEISIAGYDIQRQVGSGGMAAVYLAVQQNFDRQVAIKVLSPVEHSDKEYAERFLAEARTVAGLNHPHIIPVYDVGQVDGYYYIAMEYLPGNTLSHWIKTGLLEQEAIQVFCEIADALDYAHSKGVSHRDIKPDNIMFRENFSAVLTDFGIARSSKQDVNLTQEGVMVGTPSYMSPEQARGLKVDGRTDIYSLGAVFYEMLTGATPYQADDAMAMALAQVTEPVPQLPPAFARYQPLLEKMMAKDREQRFSSCRAVLKAVKGLQQPDGRAVVGGQAEQKHDKPAEKTELTLAGDEKAVTDTAKGKTSQPEKAPGNDSPVPLPAKSLECKVKMQRKALLFKQAVMQVSVVSEDAAQFGIRFGRISEQLLNWHDTYQGKARKLEMQVFTNPWVTETIETTVRRLREADSLYNFLDKVTIELTIYDMQGKLLAEYPSFA